MNLWGSCKIAAVLWGCSFAGLAQMQPGIGEAGLHAPGSDTLLLDVFVTDKSGKPVEGLQEKDFAVLDNKQPQKMLSFESSAGESGGESRFGPLKIFLLIDELNVSFNRIASERSQMQKFFLQNGGKLSHPVTLAFYTESGIELRKDSTNDGNALLSTYDQHVTGLRALTPVAGGDAAMEQFQRSIRALNAMAARLKQMPGRKMVIWLSPGWPIQPTGANVDLNAEQERGLFTSLLTIWNSLLQARITLYSVDPLGVDDAGGQVNYYEDFLKPVITSKRIQVANLALQVFARKTGGLVLNSSNDIAAQLNRCLADAGSYYTLEIRTGPSEHPAQYHAIEVKVEHGLTARSREGYYSQP
jgi:VWFA-related protein